MKKFEDWLSIQADKVFEEQGFEASMFWIATALAVTVAIAQLCKG